MKKKLLIFPLLLCLLLTGCGNTEKENNNESNNEIGKLKDPIVEWCELYNPNGFDTITCVISNPNKVDIDVTYDLVYYKDGKEVARSEAFSNFNVSPKHKDVIWDNYDIPKSTDVDEVKMENITVSKAQKESINAQIKHENTKDGYEYFSIKHDRDPEESTVTFFLYNDNNKNKKCDKGELVVASITGTFEKEDTLYFETEGYNYTNYEIYYNAY